MVDEAMREERVMVDEEMGEREGDVDRGVEMCIQYSR